MSDKPDAWMPLYPADWDSDTAHLSCEQDGAYGRLVRYYWRMGPPADDDAALARITRNDLKAWKRLRPALAPFFQVTDGAWRHRRVEAELEIWTAKRARFIARAAAGGRAKAAKSRAASSEQAEPPPCSSASAVEEGPRRRGASLNGAGRPADAEAAPGPFVDPEVRRAVVAAQGEAWARSWLDPCGWLEREREVAAPRRITADRLERDCGALLRSLGVRIAPVPGMGGGRSDDTPA